VVQLAGNVRACRTSLKNVYGRDEGSNDFRTRAWCSQ
jgi:hypothetical protein